jgi:hypothetical protein
VSWWRLRLLGQPDLYVPRSCCLLSNGANDSRAFLDPHPLNMSACQSLDQGLYQMARHTEVSSVFCTASKVPHITLYANLFDLETTVLFPYSDIWTCINAACQLNVYLKVNSSVCKTKHFRRQLTLFYIDVISVTECLRNPVIGLFCHYHSTSALILFLKSLSLCKMYIRS